MTKQVLSLLLASGLLLTELPHFANAQTAPIKQWDKTFGGSGGDEAKSLQQTRDGGYILGGFSNSPVSGDKTQASQGLEDYWVVKVDVNGTKQWDRTFGGRSIDVLLEVEQTSDGGYILGGSSNSPISGDKTQANQRESDYWVVKLDANGIKQWDRTFGGLLNDQLSSVRATPDGGCILGGTSFSFPAGDKTLSDYWIVKVDASGNKQWDHTFGGQLIETLYDVQQIRDGGYILGGDSFSPSSGDKTQANQGVSDYWVVKVDANGVKQWDRTFGGSNTDRLRALQQTSDGGYLLAGYSNSPLSGDKTQANPGGLNCWLLKLTADGTKVWDKTLGGATVDYAYAVKQASDGGYVVCALSNSPMSGDKTQPSQGDYDYWLFKVDANGTKLWDRTIGGSGTDLVDALAFTSDGGFLLSGHSTSGINGDKSQASQGFSDYWLVKLGAAPLASSSAKSAAPLTVSPNPTSSQLTLHGPAGTPYQLLNQLGQVVRSGKISAQPLDVQALPAGLYLLRDATSGRTSKLVKE
ncbi:T9SS type A sorting domain-containing protein [Hymenobacter sp. YC55]|uniref:T9SS type A sorting domain-containing protein n=1 Tax=Hymenobacter sp. YC55 TaxID=3034019 RepID=UPI0023F8C3D8|nr:T9SS type A sorting domain-containing protein [Hymenobacter sp. YC55]MDF7811483.1 T9SS type A sorting domain-containing protein [Hymenobacter sp. YC55]